MILEYTFRWFYYFHDDYIVPWITLLIRESRFKSTHLLLSHKNYWFVCIQGYENLYLPRYQSVKIAILAKLNL